VPVRNVAPVLTVTAPNNIVAGQPFQLNLSPTDPGQDTLSQWHIDWGDGTESTVAGTATSADHTYAASLTAAVITVQATDEDGTWTAPVITRDVLPVNPPVNQAPIAQADHAITLRDQAVTIDVLANDVEPDGQPMTTAAVDLPTHGSLTRDVAGRFVYTPQARYVGADNFSYLASDGLLFSDLVTVAIEVLAVNDAPVATPDSFSLPRDTVTVLDVLANDNDTNGDALSVEVIAGPAHGALVHNADGTLTYTPAADYSGADAFSYRASDGLLHSEPVNVSLTVTPVNHPPVLAPVADADVLEGSTYTVSLAASDVDGDALAYVLDSAPLGASVDAAGVVRWQAANGPAVGSFTAHAVDANGASSPAVQFVVNVANVAPVLTVSAPATVRAGDPFSLALSASDPGTDTITQWLVDWGDGTQSSAAGSATGAVVNVGHTYSAARPGTAIVVRAIDADGTWTAPTVTRDVLAATPAPSHHPREEDDGRERQKEQERKSRDRDSEIERARRESDSRLPRREIRDIERVDSRLDVNVVEQSAHRGSRTLAAIAFEEGSGVDANAQLSAAAMQTLIDSQPTAAGVAATGHPTAAMRQISSMVATERALRVGFDTSLSATDPQAAASVLPAMLLIRGEQVGAAGACADVRYEPQQDLRDNSSNLAVLSGGLGGAASVALALLARRRRAQRTEVQQVRVDGLDRLHRDDLDFSVQKVVPSALAAKVQRDGASTNDWEIRL
jgi:hypothetical protein